MNANSGAHECYRRICLNCGTVVAQCPCFIQKKKPEVVSLCSSCPAGDRESLAPGQSFGSADGSVMRRLVDGPDAKKIAAAREAEAEAEHDAAAPVLVLDIRDDHERADDVHVFFDRDRAGLKKRVDRQFFDRVTGISISQGGDGFKAEIRFAAGGRLDLADGCYPVWVEPERN